MALHYRSLRNHLLVHSTRQFIRKHLQLDPEQSIIVGLSGGIDSCALVFALHLLGYRIIVAHCNFHLRGEESDRDEAFVDSFCSSLGIPCQKASFDTVKYAESKHLSIETAARDLRYHFFEELRSKEKAQSIAVAHHLEDNIETMLGNMARGSGIRGLRAMLPQRDYIIRPFLETPKKLIIDFMQSANLSYCTDSTNVDEEIRRNYIRHSVRPLFDEINPSFANSALFLLQHLREIEKIYKQYTDQKTHSLFDGKRIFLSDLLQSEAPQSLLFEILAPLGFKRHHIQEILAHDPSLTLGSTWHSNTHTLTYYQGDLWVSTLETKNDLPPYTLTINQDFFESLKDKEAFFLALGRRWKCTMYTSFPTPSSSWGGSLIFLDGDELLEKEVSTLLLAPLQEGGAIAPFGMGNRKKDLGKYLRDRKIDPTTRKHLVGLYDNYGELLWIPSVGSSNNYRCTEQSCRIIGIELLDQ